MSQTAVQSRASVGVSRPTSRGTLRVNALFQSRSKAATKVVERPEPAKPKPASKKEGGPIVQKESALSQVVAALDFSAPRSQSDANLLWETKQNWKKGETKMDREQYKALRRKIGGTYKDFMKDYIVEERVENTYYKPGAEGGSVPYLPLLVGVVLAMMGTTAFVVTQTGL